MQAMIEERWSLKGCIIDHRSLAPRLEESSLSETNCAAQEIVTAPAKKKTLFRHNKRSEIMFRIYISNEIRQDRRRSRYLLLDAKIQDLQTDSGAIKSVGHSFRSRKSLKHVHPKRL
jgi:hypothetical protein